MLISLEFTNVKQVEPKILLSVIVFILLIVLSFPAVVVYRTSLDQSTATTNDELYNFQFITEFYGILTSGVAIMLT